MKKRNYKSVVLLVSMVIAVGIGITLAVAETVTSIGTQDSPRIDLSDTEVSDGIIALERERIDLERDNDILRIELENEKARIGELQSNLSFTRELLDLTEQVLEDRESELAEVQPEKEDKKIEELTKEISALKDDLDKAITGKRGKRKRDRKNGRETCRYGPGSS